MSFYGACFEPYVGPWVDGQPVLYNAYSLNQVMELLQTIKPSFSRIGTYGQGTFVWQGNPLIQDSNKWNIAAAAAVGLKCSAGCYQQGADPGGDSINYAWTKVEVDYAISQAQAHPGTVDELVVGNECIWGPNSATTIKDLIVYAKAQIAAAGLSISVTTRQEWGVLAGVNNLDPSFAATRQAIIDLLAACDGFVYANVYPYFDPGIASMPGAPTPTENQFKTAVTDSFSTSWAALAAAFSAQSITTTPRVGEIGWPTSGSQIAQPAVWLATPTFAQWHYEAISALFAADEILGFVFEAYDEPWKNTSGGGNSEAHFGIWTASGTSSSPSEYTLNGETQKYSLS